MADSAPAWPTDEQVEKAARAIDSATRNALDTHGKFSSEEMARAALSAVNPYEWRPIADALKNYAPIRLWSPRTHTYPFTGRYWPNDAWRDDEDGDICKPTHWLPLELPPSPEGDK